MRIFVAALAGMACASLYVPAAIADEADLSFNADAARLSYVRPLARVDLEADAGWLHHQDNGDVLHLGARISDAASDGRNPLVAGLGARLAWFDGDLSGQNGFALAVGGFLKYTLPRYNRVSVAGAAWFAPEVLSISDAEGYTDLELRLAYNLMREADVFIGTRYVKGEYDGAPDARFDTGMHAGIHLRF